MKQTKQNALALKSACRMRSLDCTAQHNREIAVESRHRTYRRSAPTPLRALIICAIWLHLGLVGATTVAAGLLALTEGGSGPWWLALVLAGGTLAVIGWQSGLAALQRLDPAANAGAEATDMRKSIALRPPRAGNGRGAVIRAPLEQEP